MALGTNQMTLTTGDKFIPEMWLDEIRDYLKSNLIMADLIKKIEVSGKKGDVFHIPDISALTVNDKSANTQVTLSSPTETEFTITVDKHKHVAWLVEDPLEVQSQYDLRNEYTKGAGYEIAKQIDTDILALYSGLSQSITGGATITDDNIQAGIEKLDLGDVDQMDRHLVLRPTQKTPLLDLDKFYRADFRGESSSVLSKGFGVGGSADGKKFGEIYGVNVYFTNQIPLSTTYRNLMFHRDAFSVAIQKSPRFQAQYKQEYLGWLFTVDVLYGVAEFRDVSGVVITTTS